jgi:hypothetical protein
VNTSLMRPYQFVFSGYPNGWRNRYIVAGYQAIDPTVIHCIKQRRVVPIVWERRHFESLVLERMMSEATDFGLCGGVTLSVQGRQGEAAMLSLAASAKPYDARRDVAGTLGHASTRWRAPALSALSPLKSSRSVARHKLANSPSRCPDPGD